MFLVKRESVLTPEGLGAANKSGLTASIRQQGALSHCSRDASANGRQLF